MTFKILQLKESRRRDYGFESFDFAKENGFSIEDYNEVYEGNISEGLDEPTLEELFRIFNCNRPEDFRGHSLSMSDIVVLDGRSYYCDRCGWARV